MSDPDNFLSRWSRRKIEGERSEPAGAQTGPAERKPAPQVGAAKTASGAVTQPENAEPPFDISKLPSLDSIGVDTDITAFLRPGVPADLSRAALRRAWAADPAIRDFVGLAENAWDFTAPDGVPGFGTLGAEESRRLIAQFLSNEFGEAKAVAASEPPNAAQLPPESPPGRGEIAASTQDKNSSPEQSTASENETHAMLQSSKETGEIAAQNDDEAIAVGNTRRGHGSALPN
jgi:hypothetical protein